ncbi:MAG: hypothetical protein HYV04_19570 [Deltaproteobacteria bacterium]|nr:hypothetical protein [Deltaproteobacteria bacterium]
MSAIAYYITAHGYGHTVRSREVIRALKSACPDAAVYIRSAAPQWLFENLAFPVAYRHGAVDVGFLQKDSLEMDVVATLAACAAFHERIPQLLEEEIGFLRDAKVRLIIGDIPPLCFEAAARASLPSVAIANFTWDWVYRSYFAAHGSFAPVIEAMTGSYRKATLALSLPFSCDMSVFGKTVPIPLIARVSALSKEEARKKFQLPSAAKIVLISFGGFGLERLPWDKLERLNDFFFVCTGTAPKKGKNFLVFPEALPDYVDLVRAADAVVTKPGYGIVADVIAHRTPVLYTSRGQFPEFPYLVRALTDWATSEFVPQDALLEGNLAPYLERLLNKDPNWPHVPLNGAEIAAKKILSLLSSFPPKGRP